MSTFLSSLALTSYYFCGQRCPLVVYYLRHSSPVNYKILTSVTSSSSPSWRTRANVWPYTPSSIHAPRLTDTLKIRNKNTVLIHLINNRIIYWLLSEAGRILTLAYFFHIFCLCTHPDKYRHYFSCNDHHFYKVGCRQLKDTNRRQRLSLRFVRRSDIVLENKNATVQFWQLTQTLSTIRPALQKSYSCILVPLSTVKTKSDKKQSRLVTICVYVYRLHNIQLNCLNAA